MINENGCKVYTVKDIQEMLKISRTGGYNLQWAWSSGAVAGLHAAVTHCSI